MSGQAGAITDTEVLVVHMALLNVLSHSDYAQAAGREAIRRALEAVYPFIAARACSHPADGQAPPFSAWTPLDRDGLPPASYPAWRAAEAARRGRSSDAC